MDGADPSELARRDDLIRRQMAERTERQGWVHHVVDGDTGEVLTTPLDRPLAPLSRAERLVLEALFLAARLVGLENRLFAIARAAQPGLRAR